MERPASAKLVSEAEELILQECLKKYKECHDAKDNIAYAYITALNQVIKESKESTLAALTNEVELCSDHLNEQISKT